MVLGRLRGQAEHGGEDRRRAEAEGCQDIAKQAVVQPVMGGFQSPPARAQGGGEDARAGGLSRCNGGSRSAKAMRWIFSLIGWRHRGAFTAPPGAFIPFCIHQKETI